MKIGRNIGFTLLELMIVVAIIGILAAVAVPGFMAYIRSSKTAEAKTNLDAIKKGAIAFFETEHYSDDGLVGVSKQYPVSNAHLHQGDESTPPTVGVKWDPNGELLEKMNDSPWKHLNFRISAPAYYSYRYKSITILDARGNIPASAVDSLKTKPNPASTFQAVACASLSEPADSIYTLTGNSSGIVGAPVEVNSTDGKCPKTTPPK